MSGAGAGTGPGDGAGVRIGVDLGGTKIESIALSPAGEELVRIRHASPRGDYGSTVRAVRDLICETEGRIGIPPGVARVGVGMPGSVSPATGLIRNANSVWLNGKPFAADLAEAVPNRVRLANDANCFAMSEATDGAARGADIVFGVILGTGVGGGVVIDGRPLEGGNGIAGEWGHTPMPGIAPGEGPSCWCGRRACIETFLSGPALASEFGEPGVTAADIAVRADPEAVAMMDRYVARLGRGLAQVVNVLDPEVIVLGGGMSNIERLYRDTPGAMRPHVFSDVVSTRIVRNMHGDSSGVRGAAWLWQDERSTERHDA